MKMGGLRFGSTSLARHDCKKCGEKDSLHRSNVCIHCRNDRTETGVFREFITLTARQLAHIKLLDHRRRHLIKGES